MSWLLLKGYCLCAARDNESNFRSTFVIGGCNCRLKWKHWAQVLPLNVSWLPIRFRSCLFPRPYLLTKATNPESRVMFEYSRPILSKYSDVRTSKKYERQWSRRSLFHYTFLLKSIIYKEILCPTCLLLSRFWSWEWSWKFHVNVCQIPHKSRQVVATWKIKVLNN